MMFRFYMFELFCFPRKLLHQLLRNLKINSNKKKVYNISGIYAFFIKYVLLLKKTIEQKFQHSIINTNEIIMLDFRNSAVQLH